MFFFYCTQMFKKGGVVIGVTTMGIGLLAGAIVAGGAAAAGGGVAAYQAAKDKELRILALAADTLEDAVAWRSALKKQVLLANQSLGPAVMGGNSEPTLGLPRGFNNDHHEGESAGGWSMGGDWIPIPSGSLGGVTLERLNTSSSSSLNSDTSTSSSSSSSSSTLKVGGVEMKSDEHASSSSSSSSNQEPALRAQCVVRSSTLETFISIMSETRVANAQGVLSESRVVEVVDDHTDVVYFATRPLPVAKHTNHKLIAWLNIFLAIGVITLFRAYFIALASLICAGVVISKKRKIENALQPRDFCVLRRWQVSRNGSYRICLDSIKGGHPACPVVSGRIRGSIHQVFILQPFLPRHARSTQVGISGGGGGGEEASSMGVDTSMLGDMWDTTDTTDTFTAKLANLVTSAQTIGAVQIYDVYIICFFSLFCSFFCSFEVC